MIWIGVLGCGTQPSPQPDAAEQHYFEHRCVDDADVEFCLRMANEDGADSRRVEAAYSVACNHGRPEACDHYVKNLHERDPSTAVMFASMACVKRGALCDEFHEFETLYPELESQFEIARPHIEKAKKAREAKAATP